MSVEPFLAYTWIFSVLNADTNIATLAPGGCWRALAPPEVPGTPYIIVAYMSGVDSLTMNAFRPLSKLLFQIKAVGPASNTQAIVNAAQEIETLFGGPTSGSVTGGFIDACYRDGPLAMDEIVTGELHTNIGGLYRLEVQRSS
jgi:hypothetical protein